jgi:hypothetical protein
VPASLTELLPTRYAALLSPSRFPRRDGLTTGGVTLELPRCFLRRFALLLLAKLTANVSQYGHPLTSTITFARSPTERRRNPGPSLAVAAVSIRLALSGFWKVKIVQKATELRGLLLFLWREVALPDDLDHLIEGTPPLPQACSPRREGCTVALGRDSLSPRTHTIHLSAPLK